MTLREFVTRLWKEHIVAEFPWNERCFDCDAENCEGCEVIDETRGERDGWDKVSSVRPM
jgi:hypothetical protein